MIAARSIALVTALAMITLCGAGFVAVVVDCLFRVYESLVS